VGNERLELDCESLSYNIGIHKRKRARRPTEVRTIQFRQLAGVLYIASTTGEATSDL
jgi:hypothetical protein